MNRPTIKIEVPTYEGRPVHPGDWASPPELALCSCGDYIEDGDAILSYFGRPMHASCFAKKVTSLDVDNAWLTIASQVARHPSTFSAHDIRSVILNLMRMVQARSHPSEQLDRINERNYG